MREMNAVRLGAASAAAALLLATTAGCSGEEAPRSDGASSAAGSSPSASAATTPDSADSSSGPAVAPASGKLVELDGLSLRLPDDYELLSSTSARLEARRTDALGLDLLGAFATPAYGLAEDPRTVMKRQIAGNVLFQTDPRPKAPVTVDGVKMFHAAGMINEQLWAEVYGAGESDYEVSFTFFFGPETPPEQRRETVEAVLATVELA